MAVLTTQGRKRLSKGSFAIPEKDGYPIHDPAHARNALARVSQHGTSREQSRVRAAVHRTFPSIGQKKRLLGELARQGRAHVAGASSVTPEKARLMLHEGTVHGRAITKKQRGLFGLIAGGGTPRRAAYR